MNNAILLLGGNLGNIQQNFKKAKDLISEQTGVIQSESSLYESKAWGFDTNELFLNQAIQIETSLSPVELLNITQNIEKSIGRKSKTKDQEYSSRLIDIDILFFNDEIIKSKRLTIPHPRLHLRNFTLAPLNEIMPNFTHPELNKTINWIFNNSKDQDNCRKI